MGLLMRALLAAAGALAALFVARDDPSFSVVQGVLGTALVAAVVLVLALTHRR
jgi:hypothetical protein